jgi:glycosyltransferase involved in cell wall biosynthesis
VKILFVVQRYGETIAGGAEQLVREYAVRLTERGHSVEVLTSCATSYLDWANSFPAGEELDHGVRVTRLPVQRPRDSRLFGAVHQRATADLRMLRRHSPTLDQCWQEMVGPSLSGLHAWIEANAHRFDVAVFSGYMFSPTTTGLPVAAPLLPTLLQPVAHDEPPFRLPLLRKIFDHAAAINFLTEEERDLVCQRYRPPGEIAVFGAGVSNAPPEWRSGVRQRFGLGEAPFLACVGRIDPGKGAHELVNYFRHRVGGPEDLKLVLIGSEVAPIERPPGVIVTGFVDEATKWALLREATILVQPSYFESFSLSLTEGWRVGLPAVVQGRNPVLAGQVRRAEGGLSFRNFAEFDAAVSYLLQNNTARASLGAAGQRYVNRYNWEAVLDEFEQLLRRAVSRCDLRNSN